MTNNTNLPTALETRALDLELRMAKVREYLKRIELHVSDLPTNNSHGSYTKECVLALLSDCKALT